MTKRCTVLVVCGGLLAGGCAGKGTPPGAPTATGDATGASVEVEIDENTHHDSMADMIRGQVPGLEVIESPGGEIELRVRGMMAAPDLTSANPSDTLSDGSRRGARGGFTGTEPLLVIDGMTISPGNNSRALKGLNPSNVESIVVHKDVSSTVAWGMRGANGVVVIRTKNRR